MFDYLRDVWGRARLRARYERLVQEQLLDLAEQRGPQPVMPDTGEWQLLGGSGSAGFDETRLRDYRRQARELSQHHPHAKNLLRLLDIYVVGPGLGLQHSVICGCAEENPAVAVADRLWREFLLVNQRHFTFREYARRAWRDGETFLRKFEMPNWPPSVRFIDPEVIGDPTGGSPQQGIVTLPDDVEVPLAYLRIECSRGELLEEIPAEDVLHTKLGVDSNQKRGVTVLLPILDMLERFEQWLNTELLARRLQASIVLWRKVQGSPGQAAALADSAQFGMAPEPGGASHRREKMRPGTIVTTSQGTDLQFLQPHTNFGDAAPLGRLLLLCQAAAAGLPEFMLTADAANANYSSTMVAEGPAVKLFQAEQQTFVAEFTRLWRWVMENAVRSGLLPANFFSEVEPRWTLPQLVNRDRPRERLADVRLLEAGVLSQAEVARRDGVDPAVMARERSAKGVRDEV